MSDTFIEGGRTQIDREQDSKIVVEPLKAHTQETARAISTHLGQMGHRGLDAEAVLANTEKSSPIINTATSVSSVGGVIERKSKWVGFMIWVRDNLEHLKEILRQFKGGSRDRISPTHASINTLEDKKKNSGPLNKSFGTQENQLMD